MFSVKHVDLTNNEFKYYLPVSTKTIYYIITIAIRKYIQWLKKSVLGCHKGKYRCAKEKKKIINSSVVQFSYCKEKLDWQRSMTELSVTTG